MSVPSPYTQRTTPNDNDRCRVVPSNDQAKEDCRDYLRTGRCKYGASCKYNHPLNVQSGGGIKAPIDPSEPLFPVRYNEPACQYYMKHGTCKFGQACKFHHPPQVAGTSNGMNGNTVLLGLPVGRKEDGAHAHAHAHAPTTWKTGNDSSVQILPQRLDEPNCIYFLKNGRCKYGATCRYHHPLNYHHDNRSRGGFEDGRTNSRHPQDHRSAPKVHYITALPPGSMQQGHFVVADGTVTFLSLDGKAPAHVVSISHPAGTGGKEGPSVYTTPGTLTSSTSSTSIASSFETPISNADAHESSNGSLWNNNRKASGNASSAYNLPRVVSTGSAQSDNNLYYDSNIRPPTWRGPRSASFDHTRTRSSSFSNQDDEMRRSASVQSALDERAGGRPRSASTASPMIHGNLHHHHHHQDTINTRAQRLPGEVDDGLSMMTSALLNMLDTPAEEAAVKQQVQNYEIDKQQIVTPRLDNRYYARAGLNRPPATSEDSREYHDSPSTYNGQPMFLGQNATTASNKPPAAFEDSREYHNNPSTYYGQPTFLGQNATTASNKPPAEFEDSREYHNNPSTYYEQPTFLGQNAITAEEQPLAEFEDSREYHNNASTYYGQPTFLGQNATTAEDQPLDSSMSMPTTTHGSLNFLCGQPERQAKVNQIGRIQSWQGSAAAGIIHENSQFSSFNPTQQPSGSPNTSTNVGLYY